MSFFEDYIEDDLCCSSCGQLIDGGALGYTRVCEECEEKEQD